MAKRHPKVGTLTHRQHVVLCLAYTNQLKYRYRNIGVRWFHMWDDPDGKDATAVLIRLRTSRMLRTQSLHEPHRTIMRFDLTHKGLAHIYYAGQYDAVWDMLSQSKQAEVLNGTIPPARDHDGHAASEGKDCLP